MRPLVIVGSAQDMYLYLYCSAPSAAMEKAQLSITHLFWHKVARWLTCHAQGRIMAPPGRGMKATAGPSYIYLQYWPILVLFYCYPICLEMLFSRGVNCGRTAGRIEMPLGKNFRRPQIFSLEISGPKVILLSKFLLYWAVRDPVGTRTLMHQPHQPHGWSGPDSRCITIWYLMLEQQHVQFYKNVLMYTVVYTDSTTAPHQQWHKC